MHVLGYLLLVLLAQPSDGRKTSIPADFQPAKQGALTCLADWLPAPLEAASDFNRVHRGGDHQHGTCVLPALQVCQRPPTATTGSCRSCAGLRQWRPRKPAGWFSAAGYGAVRHQVRLAPRAARSLHNPEGGGDTAGNSAWWQHSRDSKTRPGACAGASSGAGATTGDGPGALLSLTRVYCTLL